MENQVIVSDYTQMDRVLREERQYILDICKKIKKAGCNVLLIQKSILRYVFAHFSAFVFICNLVDWVVILGPGREGTNLNFWWGFYLSLLIFSAVFCFTEMLSVT